MNRDELEGNVKEGVGKLTGDKEQETEGKVQSGLAGAADKAGDMAHDAADVAEGAADAVRDRVSPDDR